MRSNKMVLAIILIVFFGTGCMSMQVKAPKDPIKVDVTMRLDVYQHVVKDIDNIEGIVSGKTEAKPKGGMKLNFLIANAYAEEGLSLDVEKAALRRKDRFAELNVLEGKGAIGENKLGMVEAKASGAPIDLVSAENADRMIIYRALAEKNNVTVESIQNIYAGRLQDNAPSGTPIEVMGASGSYKWINK